MKNIIRISGIIFLMIIYINNLFSEDSKGWSKISPETMSTEKIKEFSMQAVSYVQDCLVISFVDSSGKPNVMRYDSSLKKWTPIGTGELSDGKVEYLHSAYSFSRDGNGKYFALYKDLVNGKKVTLMSCAEKNPVWMPVGNKAFTSGAVEDLHMIYDSASICIAYLDSDDNRRPKVMQFNNGGWMDLKDDKNDHISEESASNLAFTIVRGRNYVGFADRTQNLKATLMYFDFNWLPMGNKGFSDGRINYLSIAGQYSRQSKYERTFAAYQDAAKDKKLTVMFLDDLKGEWKALGKKGFTTGTPKHIASGVYKMVPIIAFADSEYKNAVTVVYYYKNEWHTLGKPGFSEIGAADIKMAIHDELIYIGYITSDKSKHLEIQRINIAEYLKG